MKKIELIGLDDSLIPIEGTVTIGRSDENDIIVPDDKISKKHSKIIRTGDYSLCIEDTSTNGTLVLTMDGKILDSQKKMDFPNLRENAPYKLFLDDYEFFFHYPDFTTKTVQFQRPKETILVKDPGHLNVENIGLVKIIYPQAAASMIRMMLEKKIQYKEKRKSQGWERKGRQETLDNYINRLKVSDEDKSIMHKIRILGNMGALYRTLF